MSLSVLTGVFTGANQSGTGQLFGVGTTPRYNYVRSSEMLSRGLYRTLSSATVFSSSTADATLILFGPIHPLLSAATPDFSGRFVQITNPRGAGSELDVDLLSDHGFNDAATSVMVVAAQRGSELRLSFRDLFLDPWRTILDSQLSDGARRDGDPVLTWEMWPQGISHLDPNLTYLKIHQPLHIEIDWWPDYKASLTYHIRLFLNGSGRLQGFVARWAYWIEGGLKTGGIEQRLAPAVIAGADTLNQELANRLQALSGFTLRDLYYLPGRQLTRAPRGVRTGLTTDDVTLVVAL